MNILLVEDDENKRTKVAAFLGSLKPAPIVHEARSYSSAIRFLQKTPVNLTILDMSLPIFDVTSEEDGFQDDAFGGMEVLTFAHRRKIPGKFIVLTQFETLGEGEDAVSTSELGRQLAENFPHLYAGIVYYNPSESAWQEELKRLI